MSKFHDDFDYENAKRDIFDAGGDPDYLNHFDPAERDDFMQKMGLNPEDYGSEWGDPDTSDKSSYYFEDVEWLNDFGSHDSEDLFDEYDEGDEDYDGFGEDEWEPDSWSTESFNQKTANAKGSIKYESNQNAVNTNSSQVTKIDGKTDKTVTLLVKIIMIGIPIFIGGVILYACTKVGIENNDTDWLVITLYGLFALILLIWFIVKSIKNMK